MAYVLANGYCFIKVEPTGKIIKTSVLEEASIFDNTSQPKKLLEKASARTKGYFIYDLKYQARYRVTERGRIYFPPEVRKLIYNAADGKCALCGRKISYASMTLDHINPLAMGGADEVENLQCTCEACNLFKGSVLPDDFMERITEIFLYQAEKKAGNTLRWKLVHRMLRKIV